jgi:glutamate-ammonia-ligase adenylyltransferase
MSHPPQPKDQAGLFTRPLVEALAEGEPTAVQRTAEDAGFSRPEESTRHLLTLRAQGAFRRHAAEVLSDVLVASDPDGSLVGLVRYTEAFQESLGRPFDFDPSRLALLAPVFGASHFLTNYLVQDPAEMDRLAASPWLDAEKPREALEAELAARLPAENGRVPDFEELQRVLRRARASEMLRIAVRDLTGRADVEGVTRELTCLAESALEVAVRICEAHLRRRYGRPWVETIAGEKVEGTFAVIGMGKLGAGELNFSSDVDLLYIYSSQRGRTEGGEEGEPLGVHEYYVKLAEQVTRTIGEVTEDGFVFRVDLGLRPGGNRGAIVNSLVACELYYSSWGETWERSALLRARPVAGSRELGEELLRILEPIVYRKTLDMATVEDMRQMKERMDSEFRARADGSWDVKLGRGGIREIEFVIQSLQLLHAGLIPTLRETRTLVALQRLQENSCLGREDVEDLSGAYRFFRTLEHRLQMFEDRQTHLLPGRKGERRRLARSMGFIDAGGAAAEAFEERLHHHQARVEAIFGRLLAEQEPDRTEEEVDPAVRGLLDPQLPPDDALRRLVEAGFEDPQSAATRLVWLRDPPTMRGLSTRSRRLLRARGPFFLQEILRSPDPDRALAHLETFFSSTQARYTYFTVLNTHRETFRLMIRLFGTSDYLSAAFIRHPELLDSLVLSSYAAIEKSRAEMERELEAVLAEAKDFEGRLDAMRRFKRGEVLRVAFNDLGGGLDRPRVSAQLSDLAEVCFEAALRTARADLDARFGPPGDPADPGATARFALLGMGKLGGREIDYHSDLDIIYVFDPNGETRGGPGGRRITNFEYFAKLGQRVISIMTLRTNEGGLYEIDTRLRPSGNAGALVTSLENFERYHQRSAQVWERQALIRARFVAGDAELGRALEKSARRFAYGPWDPAMLGEIGRIRARMEKEIAREKPGRYNVKTGRGGLADVEFVVQALQLKHGAHEPEPRTQNTLAALAALRQAGHLEERDARDLEEGYRFLRTLEDRLRLLHDRSTSELEASGPDLEKLARRLGYVPTARRTAGAQLLGEYRERAERIRGIYERIFGGALPGDSRPERESAG